MVHYERIVLEVRDSAVEVGFPDGTRLDVPRDVISRSKLLTQTICSAEHDGNITLHFPKGVLQTWLLASALQSPGLCSPFSPQLSAYDPQLPAYIKVRDLPVSVGLCHLWCALTVVSRHCIMCPVLRVQATAMNYAPETWKIVYGSVICTCSQEEPCAGGKFCG